MSSSPTVSIIVPVYNVAGYVGRCFDSIAAQTYPYLECIFVDDCGTDASMEIVRERIEAYQGSIDFKIVRHEKNRGLSAARNTGTDSATGEYIWYVDSDDFIGNDAVADIFRSIGKNRPNIISFNYAHFTNGDDFSARLIRVPHYECISELLRAVCVYNREYWGAQFRIYRKNFLLLEELRFSEGLIHEDVDFLIRVLRTKTRLLWTNACCAYFFRGGRSGGITSSGVSKKRVLSWWMIAQNAYSYAQACDEDFQIYIEVFCKMLLSILSVGVMQEIELRELLREIHLQRKKFALLLKKGQGLQPKILSYLLPYSVCIACFALKVWGFLLRENARFRRIFGISLSR